MTTALAKVQARRQRDDLRCHAEHQRRNVEIRRLAVVQPAGSHFELRPVRTSLAAKGG